MKKLQIILSALFLFAMFNSCKKSSDVSSYKYAIRMTDAPGPYDSVYIDLQGIEITGNDGKVVEMNVNAGIYNLLHFTNGVDTLIATGSLNDATVKQIRLILGPNNSVVINKVHYPLSTPSADQSGLKLQVHHTIQAGVQYEVLLDFDANESIVETGSNTYKLKPVIRTVETAISGSIKGKITPIGTLVAVSATSGATYSSSANADGDFIIKGVPAGNYTVILTPASPFSPVTLTNVVVVTGSATNVGVINF